MSLWDHCLIQKDRVTFEIRILMIEKRQMSQPASGNARGRIQATPGKEQILLEVISKHLRIKKSIVICQHGFTNEFTITSEKPNCFPWWRDQHCEQGSECCILWLYQDLRQSPGLIITNLVRYKLVMWMREDWNIDWIDEQKVLIPVAQSPVGSQ